MTISVMPEILTNILGEGRIAPEKLAYLEARAKLRLHDLILRRFQIAEDSPDRLDQAKIARRLGVSRARVSQQLAVPGNWTVASVTKLAAAMGGEIDFTWLAFPVPESTDTETGFASKVTGQEQQKRPLPYRPATNANTSGSLPR
jgi:DNA-binding transcriptional regulator YdaS (Cro superfamily)